MEKYKILITGASGFIGYHLALKLTQEGHQVTGLDVINDYYDVQLKYARLERLGVDKNEIKYGKVVMSSSLKNFDFIKLDLIDRRELQELFRAKNFEIVINLAAQAGVRYSIENPQVYLESNIQGFLNLLECCRLHVVKHLLYASTSSVYGLSQEFPLVETQNTDKPISFYAATKKTNELFANCYSHLFKIPSTGLRFFTVYGPWGRPDMALFLFTKAMLNGKPINIFNEGKMYRDFTYVSDIVEGINGLISLAPNELLSQMDTPSGPSFHRVVNIGNSKPVLLLECINELERALGMSSEKNYLPMQPGDVEMTHSDVSLLRNLTGYEPKVSLTQGISEFVKWYKDYYL